MAQTNAVGFKTIRTANSKGNPWIIAIWYPAKQGGAKMTIADYIVSGSITESAPDSSLLKDFRKTFNSFYTEAPLVPDNAFSQALARPTLAARNAEMLPGKFPLVIGHRQAYAMVEMYEYMASQGMIVATVFSKYVKPEPFYDSLVYVPYTNELNEFADYMLAQPNVDPSRLAGIGHGGNVQAPFYLAMRNTKIQMLVNIDGGVFSPGSKTTRSPDYNPSRLKVPMLHLIGQIQKVRDNEKEFNALQNERYRVVIQDPKIDHQLFTTWGRIMLSMDKNEKEKEHTKAILDNINKIIVDFILNKKLRKKDVPAGFEFDVF
jgi:hypothetical protein